jgi:hypothetical protein
MTTISSNRYTHCPFSATIELIERLHRSGAVHTVGPFSGLHTCVHCELAQTRDYTDRTRIHEALVLRWKVHAPVPVPVLRGMITVRPEGPATEIRMHAKYRPPLGFVGRIFDAVAGRWLAQRTVDRFLDDVKQLVEHEWAHERHVRHDSTPAHATV